MVPARRDVFDLTVNLNASETSRVFPAVLALCFGFCDRAFHTAVRVPPNLHVDANPLAPVTNP